MRKRYIKSEKLRYLKNKDKLIAYSLNYYHLHKDKINKLKREKRRINNPDWFNKLPKHKKIKIVHKINTKIIYPNGIRERDLIRRYNLKWIDYQNLILKQNNLCYICNKPESRKRKDGNLYPLHIDHDHKTGKVRGLLCNKCNNGLGFFDDNINYLLNAIKYLKQT